MGILTHDEILKLHAAVVSAQLVASRSALLAGIDGNFVAGLPHAASPSDEILEHLNALNEAGTLSNGTVSLAIWLKNALARAGAKKEAAIFRTMLERCGVPAESPSPTGAAVEAVAPPSGPSAQTRPAAATGAADDNLALADVKEKVRSAAPAPPTHEIVPAAHPAKTADRAAADVLILTAITLEYRAVLQVEAGAWDSAPWQQGKSAEGLPLAFRTFRGRGGAALRVALAQAGDMGTLAAASALVPLIHEYAPTTIAMSGVCAGRAGKTNLGDVIAAERLFFHDTGKQFSDDIQQDLRTYNLRDDWKVALEHFDFAARFREAEWWQKRPIPYEWQENWVLAKVHDGVADPYALPECDNFCPQWEKVIDSLWRAGDLNDGVLVLTDQGRSRIQRVLIRNRNRLPDLSPAATALPFRVHVAPMGSGNKVIEDASIWSFVSEHMRKTLGLEMEAAALGALAHTLRSRRLDALVMKGVMDFADNGRDDHFKEFAARASAESLIAFLREHLETKGESQRRRPATPKRQRTDVPVEQHGNSASDELASVVSRHRLFIEERTRAFTGRVHIFDSVKRFCDGQDKGYLRIQGDPGIGKSALLAELVRMHAWVASLRLQVQGFQRVLDEVCLQLIDRFGLPRELRRPTSQMDGVAFTDVLVRARERATGREPIIIAIDAVDELDPMAPSEKHNALDLPDSLPQGVFVVLAHRDDAVPLRALCPSHLIDLMSFPKENRDDIETYLRRMASADRTISAGLAAASTPVGEFVQTLTDRSENNFMYLRYILDDMRMSPAIIRDLKRLPVGLRGYYEGHWSRMMRERPESRKGRMRVVYCLSVLRESVTQRELAELSSVDMLEVASALEDWRPFLHRIPSGRHETRFKIYHRSFQDFLARQDIVQGAGVSPEEMERNVVKIMLQRGGDLLEPL